MSGLGARPSVLMIRAGVLACVVIWGTTWAVIRVGLAALPPLTSAALRFVVAGAVLLAVALARRTPLGRSAREWWLWPINGLLSFSVSYGVVYWAEQWVPSGLASVIFAAFPLFVALFAHVALPDERLRPASVAGMVLGLGGMAIIFSADLGRGGGPGATRAALLLLLSPLVSAVATVAVKRWGQGIAALSLTSVPMLIGAATLGVMAALWERQRPLVWSAAAVGSIVYLALIGSAAAFLLYFWLLERVEATRLALVAYASPVCAVVVGIVFMHERATVASLVGSGVVLGGVALASRPRPEPARGRPEPIGDRA